VVKRQASSPAHKLRHSFQVLAWAQSKLKLDMIKEVERVPAEGIEAVAGFLYEIIEITLRNSRIRRRATTPQFASIRSCLALYGPA
jgi:hypothetical protein